MDSERVRFPWRKDAEGTWSVTTPPAIAGFHYYWFVLDGVSVNDPSSQAFFGYGKETSGVEVPEPGADYYAIAAVPHGEVREKRYLSKTIGSGDARSSTRRQATIKTRRLATRCSFCSTDRVKTKPAGRGKAERNSFSIT